MPRPGVRDLGDLDYLADVPVHPDDHMIRRIHYELLKTSPTAHEVRLWSR